MIQDRKLRQVTSAVPRLASLVCCAGNSLKMMARRSRISSAVLVQVKGLGFSFQTRGSCWTARPTGALFCTALTRAELPDATHQFHAVDLLDTALAYRAAAQIAVLDLSAHDE